MTKKVSRPAAVGQREVQEDDVEGALRAALHARRKQLHVDQLEGAVPAVAQQVAHDPDVVGIIFHQQDSDCSSARHRRPLTLNPGRAASTISNQYLPRVSIRSTKARNVTGLVT